MPSCRRRCAPRAASAWRHARPARSAPRRSPPPIARRVETTCPYCGVGCGITLNVRDDHRLAVMADDAPANQSSEGMLCVKGRFATGFVHARDRIVRPMVKRDGRWHPVSWDEALDAAAEGLARHRGRFGALASAKATNEDGYVIQKLCRAVMDTNNVDHCTRLCHSPSVEAMLVSMGSGATSNSYVDYERGGVPDDRGGGRIVQSSGHRHPLPAGHDPRRPHHRHQPQAHGAVRPGRSLSSSRARAPTSRCSTRWPASSSTRAWRISTSSPRAPRASRTGGHPSPSSRSSAPRRSPASRPPTSPRPRAGTRARRSPAPA